MSVRVAAMASLSICLLSTGCGTEVVNPKSKIEADLSGSIVYFSKARNESDITSNPAPSTTHAPFAYAGNDLLLKLTDARAIEPALTFKGEDTAVLPTVIRMSRIHEVYYALFDEPVSIEGSVCTLVRFIKNNMECIDSTQYPAAQLTYESYLPRTEAEKSFLVARRKTRLLDGLYYPVSTTGHYKPWNSKHVLAANFGSGPALFSPSGYFSEAFYQNRSEELFSINCFANLLGATSYGICKLDAGNLESISPAIDGTKLDVRVQQLSDDKIIISAKHPSKDVNVTSMHLRIGELGPIVDINFGEDLKVNLSPENLQATYEIDRYFRTKDGSIYGVHGMDSDASKADVFRIFPSFASYANHGERLTAVEYNEGSPVTLFYKGRKSCTIKLLHENEATQIPCPAPMRIITAKYINRHELVVGGPSSIELGSYLYYILNLKTGNQTLLLRSQDPMYIHAF